MNDEPAVPRLGEGREHRRARIVEVLEDVEERDHVEAGHRQRVEPAAQIVDEEACGALTGFDQDLAALHLPPATACCDARDLGRRQRRSHRRRADA